jgi:heme oxygenase
MSSLKDLTAAKHKIAESQPFIVSIFQGKVDKEKYIDYLYQLRILYHTMEYFADKIKLLDGIEDIKRAKAIELDFAELANGEMTSYMTKPSTLKYLKYLDSIQNNPKALMAHIYVRHMGDLFGGQALAKLLPGPNNMFKFEDIPSLIKRVREKLDVSMAEEANLAFDFNIAMIKEYND